MKVTAKLLAIEASHISASTVKNKDGKKITYTLQKAGLPIIKASARAIFMAIQGAKAVKAGSL